MQFFSNGFCEKHDILRLVYGIALPNQEHTHTSIMALLYVANSMMYDPTHSEPENAMYQPLCALWYQVFLYCRERIVIWLVNPLIFMLSYLRTVDHPRAH